MAPRTRRYDVALVALLLAVVSIAGGLAWLRTSEAPTDSFDARAQILLLTVTAAAVVVAAWFVYLERQVARATLRQAESAARQVDATEQRLEAMRAHLAEALASYAFLSRQIARAAQLQNDATNRHMETAEQQLLAVHACVDEARRHLASLCRESRDARVASLRDRRPVVLVDRGDDAGCGYVVRNVGGGPALNVYYFDVTLTQAVSLGSMVAGASQALPEAIHRAWCSDDSVVKCLIVAEGAEGGPSQWNPVLNLRTAPFGDHRGTVIHRPALPTVVPPEGEHERLGDYVTANFHGFRRQLHALTDGEPLGADLLALLHQREEHS